MSTAWPLHAAPPAGYYQTAEGLTGTPLKNALNAIIDGHTIIPYGSLPAPLRVLWEDPAQTSKIRLIYGSPSVSKTASTWNREHIWPRSRGNSDQAGADDSDLHHVFPCDVQVNSTRGSLPFDLSSQSDGGIIAPAHPEAPDCTRDDNSWQPPPNERGDIARALFYMAVRYDGVDSNTTDLELTNNTPTGSLMGKLSTLIAWHLADPPDSGEVARNDKIFQSYQFNRNPFIDRPEWVQQIWNTGAVAVMASAAAPDPSANESPVETGTFQITLSAPAPSPITVNFAISGTAVAADYSLSGTGIVYAPASGTGSATISQGGSSATITLTPTSDVMSESGETVVLTVTTGASYQIAGGPATITIVDSGLPPPPSGVIATWLFDASTHPSSIAADTGTGTVSLSGWQGTVAAFSGTSGNSLSLVGSSGNGSWIDVAVDTSGFSGITATFETRGTSEGFNSGTWSWSIGNGPFTVLAGVNTATRNTSYAQKTVDFSQVAALNGAGMVRLRYTLSGCTSSSGNNRIDNLTVSGTALPRITLEVTDSITSEVGDDPAACRVVSDVIAPSGGLTVSVAFGGTGQFGIDYIVAGVSGSSVVIPAGSMAATVTFTAMPDAIHTEFEESITATIYAGQGYVLGSPAAGKIVIEDDTPYSADWTARFPTWSGASTDPELDTDNDGISNLFEYIFDGNPLLADRENLPSGRIELLSNPDAAGAIEPFAIITFRRRLEVAAEPMHSIDLIAWTDDVVLVATQPGAHAGTQIETWRARDPFPPLVQGILPAHFFRIVPAPN